MGSLVDRWFFWFWRMNSTPGHPDLPVSEVILEGTEEIILHLILKVSPTSNYNFSSSPGHIVSTLNRLFANLPF